MEPSVSAHSTTVAAFGCTAKFIPSTGGTRGFADVLVPALTSPILRNDEELNAGDFPRDYVFHGF